MSRRPSPRREMIAQLRLRRQDQYVRAAIASLERLTDAQCAATPRLLQSARRIRDLTPLADEGFSALR